MTPAEHLARAEAQLAQADDVWRSGNSDGARQDVLEALTHAVIAVAAELGVPHAEITTGGGPGGAQETPG